MSELDLSKAYDAVDESGDWPWWFNSERIVNTALPHILEALLSMAEAEQREQDDYDPYVAVEAVQFLTARIEDLRDAH